jgi:DNA-binding NtrC family response regulator
MSPQVKLLRFLQDKEYRPLGSRKARTANLRIIAASNADLQGAVRAGRFRSDLYYRLSVVEMILPPLRERGRDVELLAIHFLKLYSTELKRTTFGFTTAAKLKLAAYNWPGNVRELENAVARAVLFSSRDLIHPEDIALPHTRPESEDLTFKVRKAQSVSADGQMQPGRVESKAATLR